MGDARFAPSRALHARTHADPHRRTPALNPQPHHAGVVACFEKVGPSVLVYLSERTLKLASPKLGSDEVRVFCDIQQEKLFTDYRIESLANNSILFEVRACVRACPARGGVPKRHY